jgi:hypothetical protein
MPEAGIEPIYGAKATTGLQSAADPFGLSGFSGIRTQACARPKGKSGRFKCSATLKRPALPKSLCLLLFWNFGEREQPLPRD